MTSLVRCLGGSLQERGKAGSDAAVVKVVKWSEDYKGKTCSYFHCVVGGGVVLGTLKEFWCVCVSVCVHVCWCVYNRAFKHIKETFPRVPSMQVGIQETNMTPKRGWKTEKEKTWQLKCHLL